MDPVKTGKRIASLRRRANLTQEKLGEKIGVTNKTISRWENGNYMPDLEMLQLLCGELGVSIQELLSGEPALDPAPKAEQSAAAPSDAFLRKEREAYFQQKWVREHTGLLVVLGLLFAAALALPVLVHKPWGLGFAPLVGLVEYGYQNHRKRVYVEKHLYD